MSWYLRKSYRLLPGLRLNLSRSGPRLSLAIPGFRASFGRRGPLRLYAGRAWLRYQKSASPEPPALPPPALPAGSAAGAPPSAPSASSSSARSHPTEVARPEPQFSNAGPCANPGVPTAPSR